MDWKEFLKPDWRRIVITIIFILIQLFTSMTMAKLASATSIRGPYLELHCNVKTDFLERNLCTFENCTPKIIKTEYGYYTIDNIKVFIMDDEGIINFPYFFRAPYYVETINESTFNFLKNICVEDISPVITRVKQGNFSGMIYCDFYQDKDKLVSRAKIETIDGWYLGCYSYKSSRTDPMIYLYILFWGGIVGGILWIPFVIMLSISMNWLLIPLIILALILIYLKKKDKLKLIYILPLFFGFLGGIISYFKSTNKKVGLKLLLMGFLISFIFGLLFTFFFLLSFL